MTSGMDIAFIGKITYYAIAVYILFFIGLLFVCRYRFKRKRARRDERKLQANQPKDHRDNQSFKERGCSSPIDQDSCKSQEVFEDMGKSQSKSYKVSNSTVDELKGPRKRKIDGPNAPNSAEKEERPPTAPPTTGVTMGVKSDVSTKIHDDRCIENSKVKPLHSERASVKFERKVYVETVEINYTITVGSENQVDVGGDSKEKDIDNNDQVRDISSSEFIPVDISCQTTKDDTVVVDSTDKESEETAESVEIPISNKENLQKDDDEMGVQSDDHIKANLDLGYSVNSYTSLEKLASQLSEAVINNSIDAACGILCKECECAKESAVSISLARVESMKMPCLSSEPEQNYDEIDNYAQHVSSAIIGDAVESVGKCSIPKDMARSNNQRFLEGVSELADNIVEASIENGINDLFGHHDLKGSTSSLNSAVSASETNIAECKSEREDAITIHAHQLSKQILEDSVKDVTYILSLRKQSSLEASQLQKDCIYDISEKVTSKVIQDAVKMAAYLLAKQRIIEKSKELSKNGPPSQLIKFKMNHFANKLSSGLVKSSIQQTRSRPLIKGANGSVSRLNPSIVQQIHSARTKVVGQYAQRLAGSVSEAALHKAKHTYSPEGRAGEDFFDLLTRTVISEAMHELFDKSVHPRNCSRSEGIMPDLSTKVKDFGKSDEITFDISTRDNERKISFREDMENVDVISSQEHNVIPQFTEHGADSIVGEKPLDSVTIIHEAIKNSSESNVEKDNEIATPQTSEIIDPQQSENSNKHPNEKDVDLNNESCGSLKQVIRKKMSQASLASPVEPNISLSYHNSSTDADAEYDGYDSSEEFSDSSEDEVVDYSVRHHVKKVGADRPLSGYAEKLAQLLAIEDDDDDLEFLDSDDEMDTVLEKIEKKYPRNRKISREVHRIRKHSINKDTDATHIKADRELKPLESDLLSDLLNNDDSFVFSDDDDSLISTSPAKNADVPPVPRDDDVCKTGYQSNRQSMSPGGMLLVISMRIYVIDFFFILTHKRYHFTIT